MKISRAEPSPQRNSHGMHLGFFDRFFFKSYPDRNGFNRRMFDEDFTGLFSLGSNEDGNLFEIKSNEDETLRKLLGNVKTRYSVGWGDETVCELVEEIAQSLIWFGRSYYFLHDDTERGEVHVTSFGSQGFFQFFGTHFQWVPKRRERLWSQDDEGLQREIRILNTAKLMRFDMPKSIERMLSAQNKILAVIDKNEYRITDFQSESTYENPNPANHFDFSLWRDARDRVLYRVTRGTGWNGRKYDSSKRSDFFDCLRMIRFRRNQLLLRDDILNQLSIELSRVGKRYKAGFSVKITGANELASVANLNQLEERLLREDVEFNEVIDYCYKN